MRVCGRIVMSVSRTIAAALFLCLFPLSSHAWHLEAGEVTLLNTFNVQEWTSVTFQSPFDVAPVVVVLPSSQGGDPSDLRLRNITTTGFEVLQVEPQGRDGPHIPMLIHYIAAEPGSQSLPDGSRMIVGTVTTTALQQSGSVGSWEPIGFATPLYATPAVVANIQTMNSETNNPPATVSTPFLSTVIENAGPTGFDIALEMSQTTAGSPLAETIGYIAVEDGAAGSFLDTGAVTTRFEATRTPAIIQGWSDGCFTVTYSGVNFSNPQIVATKNSRTETDGGWVRYCDYTGTTVRLRIDEDTATDGERNQLGQVAGILAFDRPFHAEFYTDISAQKTAQVMEDPINGTTNPYALPGARVRYTINAQNIGNLPSDNGSIDLKDIIPPEMKLVVSDIAGPGSGPLTFTDGTPASGLTYTFGGLSDLSDSVAFSNNGGATFNYVPTPGADGSDPAVTHIAFRPTGRLSGSETGATHGFSITFDLIID